MRVNDSLVQLKFVLNSELILRSLSLFDKGAVVTFNGQTYQRLPRLCPIASLDRPVQPVKQRCYHALPTPHLRHSLTSGPVNSNVSLKQNLTHSIPATTGVARHGQQSVLLKLDSFQFGMLFRVQPGKNQVLRLPRPGIARADYTVSIHKLDSFILWRQRYHH